MWGGGGGVREEEGWSRRGMRGRKCMVGERREKLNCGHICIESILHDITLWQVTNCLGSELLPNKCVMALCGHVMSSHMANPLSYPQLPVPALCGTTVSPVTSMHRAPFLEEQGAPVIL